MERKTKQIIVRVTGTQKKEMQRESKRENRSISNYFLFLHNAWKNRRIH